MATKQQHTTRERSTGRYGFDGNWERLCTCGHRLGFHTGVAPHSCIASDFIKCDCECTRFRPATEAR